LFQKRSLKYQRKIILYTLNSKPNEHQGVSMMKNQLQLLRSRTRSVFITGAATFIIGMPFNGNQLEATPPFQTISLSEFGAIPNQNATLQPTSLLTAPGATFRTNDYQNLEQSYDFTRNIVRVGSFYVSSAPYLSAADPGGPALNYPSNVSNYSQAIVTSPNDVQFIFSSVEVGANDPYVRSATVVSSETFLMKYTLTSAPANFITDYCVAGNAYHDIQYNNLTPLISNRAAIISAAVDGVVQPAPLNGVTLPAGSKLRLGLNNGQTWILYIEQSASPVTFIINQAVNGLQASGPLTGFIRVAIVQPTIVPTTNRVIACSDGGAAPCMDWSTSAEIQTLPANPANMYLLWPYQWVPKIGTQITTFIEQNHYMPSCDIVSQILPVLAESDLTSAISYFNQIAPNLFDNGVNPFTVYFNMLMASNMSSDIQNYQQTNRPYPTYNVTATAASVEAEFDTYRHCIPVAADVLFDSGTYYSWTYTTIGSTNTPLIIFPSYKTLASNYSVIPDFVNMDPIKGPIYAVAATNKLVRFQEGNLPEWYSWFFPPVTFTPDELTTLVNLFNTYKTDTLQPGNSYFKGKMLYRLALTAQYGAYVLSLSGQSHAEIMAATEPLINQIKAEFQSWLITRPAPGNDVNGYFMGDTTANGICSVSGMRDPTAACNAPAPGCTGDDFGNAFYNDHHFHYGYWLAAAAIVIDWDEKFQPQNAWIAQMQTSNGGTGAHKMKYFVDMFWRDSRNPAKDDIFNFNRHGNLWEGHSTANGMLCCLYGAGRNQESLAEDFHSWMGAGRYARSILKCSALTAEDKAGFETLQTFCDTNLKITATAGKLYYQDNSWIYGGSFADSNITVGNQWDIKVDYATFFAPGPACSLQ
jgi:endoglucanase Acf2